MMKNRLFTALLAGLLFLLEGHAQESSALPFISIDRNPASAAMGGSQAVSGLYNPSMIPFTGSDVVFSYQLWAPATLKNNNLNLLGAFKVGDRFGINVEGAYQMGEPYAQMSESGIPGKKTFRPTDLQAGIGAGFAFTGYLSAGVSIRFANSTIESGTSYSAIGADAFVTFHKDALSATAGIASIGSSVKSGSHTYSLPTSVKAGVGYDMKMGENSLKLAGNFDYFLSGGVGAAAGGEFAFKDILFLRAGAHIGTGTSPLPTYLSLGSGVKFAGFHADFCWLTANEVIGNTLMVGIGYCF